MLSFKQLISILKCVGEGMEVQKFTYYAFEHWPLKLPIMPDNFPYYDSIILANIVYRISYRAFKCLADGITYMFK